VLWLSSSSNRDKTNQSNQRLVGATQPLEKLRGDPTNGTHPKTWTNGQREKPALLLRPVESGKGATRGGAKGAETLPLAKSKLEKIQFLILFMS